MFNFNDNFYADVRIEDKFNTSIQYQQKRLENYRNRKEQRAFIRVFDGNMWYYTSTAQLNQIQAELDNLYAQATPCPDILSHPAVAKFEVNQEKCLHFTADSIRDVPKQRKLQLIESYLGITDNQYLQMEDITYIENNKLCQFYSSKGAVVEYDYQTIGISIDMSLVHGQENFVHSYIKAGVRLSDIASLHNEVKKEVEVAVDFLLNATPCDKGDFPVVMSPVVSGVFAHESFGHKSEADFMLGDDNAKKDWTIGKTIGSPLLSIYDSGVQDGTGYAPFDDEGTRAKKNYLIKDGKLAGRLHSALTASVFNEELTGNARAISCKYEPIVRMTSTIIEAGKSTLEELIAPIKEGYYIKNLKHGSGMSRFTIAPSVSYRIKDGKIDKPVKISVLTGDVFETLGLIDGLSEYHEVVSFVMGGCGKGEQMGLPVSFGGPYVRVSKMNVQ